MEVLATRVGMLLSRDQKRRKEERKPFFSMSTVRDSAAEGGAGRSRAEPGGAGRAEEYVWRWRCVEGVATLSAGFAGRRHSRPISNVPICGGSLAE